MNQSIISYQLYGMSVPFLWIKIHSIQAIFIPFRSLVCYFFSCAMSHSRSFFLKSQSFRFLCGLSLTGLLFAVTLQLLCCAAASRLSNYSILLGSASKHISLAILFSVQIKADSNFTKPLSFFFSPTLTLLCSLMYSVQILHWTARMMKFKTPRMAHKTAVSYCQPLK